MKGFVYILTNNYNNVLYTGVTSNLIDRIIQHRDGKYKSSFTAKYNVKKLVYFEELDSIGDAIKREKQIKAGNRKKKTELVNSINPGWVDLVEMVDGGIRLLRHAARGSQ